MRNKGFTLIELLIVVVILAILASIAMPNFLEAQTRSKVARSMSDMRAMATAIEAYAVDHNYYPLNGVLIAGGTIQNPQTSMGGAAAHKFLWEALTTPVAYITALPGDPFVLPEKAPVESWREFWPRYFFTNLDWFESFMQPTPLPVIAQKRDMYGIWILAAAGPDGDRLDLAFDIQYDPTNGTVSNGDIIRGPKRLN